MHKPWPKPDLVDGEVNANTIWFAILATCAWYQQVHPFSVLGEHLEPLGQGDWTYIVSKDGRKFRVTVEEVER